MSVVINSNFAATLAANNLAASNQSLQRSLNRLSSGSKIVSPADDAGGLAVSMKLSAAAKRQGAVASNIGNSVSFLQSQDGVLKTAGKVLERIGELKTLASDPTKNSTDIDNYNSEFVSLQDQLTSLGSETFNGKALFGSAPLSVATTESGGGGIDVGGAELISVGSSLNESFNDLGNWTDQSTGGSASASGGTLTLDKTGGAAKVATTQTFSGPLEINYVTTGAMQINLGGTGILTSIGGGSFRLVFDGAGNVDLYSGGSYWTSMNSMPTSASTISFEVPNGGGNTGTVSNFSVSSSNSTDTGDVASATSLTDLSLSSVTDAIQQVATLRATNGAQQSRLGYAAEVLATNKANLEAANSRIVDVDVASESTQMARYNILVQAGTAMLSQANQSSQSALRLIG